MTQSKLEQNILAQAGSLSQVLHHQVGHGAASLAQAARLIQSKRRVVITGMGASLFASIPLEISLCSLGIDAVAIESGELLHFRSHAFQNAVAIVVSRSGESIEVIRLLESWKGRVPIIGVCNEPQSTLARQADIGILIGSLDDEMVSIQTYTGTLLALHCLAGAVAASEAAHADAAATLLPAFAALVESSFNNLTQWDSFFRTGAPPYLLARGPSCASAYEGALLFHEVAKSAAVGMAAGSFRHGPVEVVDKNFCGIVFAPAGPTREMNLALARDLACFGGNLCVVGPSLGDLSEALRRCETEPAAGTLSPLFEIVPIQTAALRLAQLRGIPPGSFRFAPRVAVDEATFNTQKES